MIKLLYQVLCIILFNLLFGYSSTGLAAKEEVVNVYIWANWISPHVIAQFEKETGIKVNFSTYDSNEVLYAKLRASKKSGYDVVAPSSFYVSRIVREGLLEKIDKKKLPHFINLDRYFLNKPYDPGNQYSIPFAWGVTGIFYNTHYYPGPNIQGWADFWDKKYQNQLLLLNDMREVFPIALLTLGYSVNDSDSQHLREAYLKLKKMMPNVKLFNADAVASILIDEDATIGMAWNGDIFRARKENPNIQFIFPKEGFMIWLDCLSVAKGAPHIDNAYKFINFVLRPDIASVTTLDYGFATTNARAQKFLPLEIRDNPIINPPAEILQQGTILQGLSDKTLAIYEQYWEHLKMGA